MRTFAAQVLSEITPEALGDRLLVITGPAPVVAIDRFATVFAPTNLLLWDPDGLDSDGWSFAGVGDVLRVEGNGESRFDSIKAGTAKGFEKLVEKQAPGLGPLPAPRFFGGLSFFPQEPNGPWAGFGQASFILPRWVYGRRQNTAFLRVVLRADELKNSELALAEINALVDVAEAGPTAPTAGSIGQSRLEELGFDRWARRIASALSDIRSGRFEKVVAARRSLLNAERNIDVAALLTRMGQTYVDSARFALSRGDAVFVGATPERLVSRRGAVVECDGLAGSRARGTGADEEGARALLASMKDRREHAPVVAGIRAALQPYCESIEASETPLVRTLRTVHHLWTPIVAKLAGPTHVLDLVKALHPTPAVSGLPRAPAMEWIAENEPEGRGWYAAPVGWLDSEGNGSFLVAIRSALIHGREAWLYAGGGIVEGSDPAAEYQETALKQGTMLAALGAAR